MPQVRKPHPKSDGAFSFALWSARLSGSGRQGFVPTPNEMLEVGARHQDGPGTGGPWHGRPLAHVLTPNTHGHAENTGGHKQNTLYKTRGGSFSRGGTPKALQPPFKQFLGIGHTIQNMIGGGCYFCGGTLAGFRYHIFSPENFSSRTEGVYIKRGGVFFSGGTLGQV